MRKLIAFLFLLTAPPVSAQFMDGQYMGWFPNTDDNFLNELYKKDIKFYTHPNAFQTASETGHLLIASDFKLAATDRSSFGNANFEFPWKKTSGLKDDMNAKVMRFVHFAGPITYWKQRYVVKVSPNQDVFPIYMWSYHPGTVFGELMFVTDPEGNDYVFEVRTREKQADGSWKPRTFVPSITTSGTTPKMFAGVVFGKKVEYDLEDIGEVNPNILKGVKFVRGETTWTSSSNRSIVPKDYTGAQAKCATCHETVGKHVWDFSITREWYGHVRGSDQIFSFLPLDHATIIRGNAGPTPRPDPKLVEMGLLKPWQGE